MYDEHWLAVISIHSLVKRETCSEPESGTSGSYFNPLPRKEGDNVDDDTDKRNFNFNPLPRKEGDRIQSVHDIPTKKFQSTPS